MRCARRLKGSADSDHGAARKFAHAYCFSIYGELSYCNELPNLSTFSVTPSKRLAIFQSSKENRFVAYTRPLPF